MSRMYNYVRSRQLEGTYPGDRLTGCSIGTSFRIMKGWGVPKEAEWPYEGNISHWPPIEPAGVDKSAKNHRILAYQRARSLDDCKLLIASGLSVVAGFAIDDSWSNAPNGQIPIPTKSSRVTAGHAIHFAGFDDDARQISFANSWGIQWGDKGYGYLPYEYFESRFVEAWFISAFQRPERNTSPRIKNVGWGIAEPYGSVLHGAEILHEDSDEVIGWSFAVERESYLDIEELFVRPQWRGKGYGRSLAVRIIEVAATTHLPLRMWIPHSDRNRLCEPENLALYYRLGLTIHASPEPWASAVGLVNRN